MVIRTLLPLLCLCLIALTVTARHSPDNTANTDNTLDISANTADISSVSIESIPTRPRFQPVSKFDASRLIGVKWYELIYTGNFVSLLDACTRELYTCLDDGRIALQYGAYEPGLNGEFFSGPNIIKQVGHSGTFKIVNEGAAPGEYYYILDYDRKDSEWIIFGIDYEGDFDYIILISETPQNVYAVQRTVDLAVKYGLNSHILELQTRKCDYATIFKNFKKELPTLS